MFDFISRLFHRDSIYTQRLKNFIRALEEAPKIIKKGQKNEFNMAAFFHRCGSPACVLGHYALRTDLQNLLKYGRWNPVLVSKNAGIGYDSPEILKHFNITSDEAHQLFSKYGCGGARTRKEAIRYIRNFIKERS